MVPPPVVGVTTGEDVVAEFTTNGVSTTNDKDAAVTGDPPEGVAMTQK